MKTRLLNTSALSVPCLLSAVLWAAALPPLHAGEIADAIRPYVAKRTLAGAVLAVASKDGILATEAVGFANIETKTPMRPDTIFRVASMTKPMTSACVMILVDEGKLSLDDPVEKFIPEFKRLQVKPKAKAKGKGKGKSEAVESAARPPARPITIRHLLSNSSGLQDGVDLDARREEAGLPLSGRVKLYAASPLLFDPGAGYNYAGPNFNTAARIVEIVSGAHFEDFLKKRILDPLGMKDTTFRPTARQFARCATTYKGDPKKNTLTPMPDSTSTRPHPNAGGGLFSTANDFARFGIMMLNKGVYNGTRILSEKSVDEMTRRQTPSSVKNAYGLGFNIDEKDGCFQHGGARGTHFAMHPQSGAVAVLMLQKDGPWGGPDGDKIRPTFTKLAIALVEKNASGKK